MHIQLETNTQNTITSYNDSQLIVNHIVYQKSLIISKHQIISPWNVRNLSELNESTMDSIVQLNPEVILIGHSEQAAFPPVMLQSWLSQRRIGLECMPMGAACRTFNLLLTENRNVIVGLLF